MDGKSNIFIFIDSDLNNLFNCISNKEGGKKMFEQITTEKKQY